MITSQRIINFRMKALPLFFFAAMWLVSPSVQADEQQKAPRTTQGRMFSPQQFKRAQEDFITREAVPFIRGEANRLNGWEGYPGIIAFGCSLGALHAANLFFRFPDLFDGLLALSGIYTASYGFDGYMDEEVYRNSPVDYLAGMPSDHPYIQRYNHNRGILCVGQGPWEIPETTLRLRDIFAQKGIQVWVDVWGYDCAHDWDWWYKQVAYFVPFLLD